MLDICIHLFQCVPHFSQTNLSPVPFIPKATYTEERSDTLIYLYFLNWIVFYFKWKKKVANIKDTSLLLFCQKIWRICWHVNQWFKIAKISFVVGNPLTILSTQYWSLQKSWIQNSKYSTVVFLLSSKHYFQVQLFYLIFS